jgi:hypothetical protein
MQQCEEAFQGHGYVEHAREFGSEHACNSVFPARWRHITYCTNEYGEVARNVSTSSDLTVSWLTLATKISWFLTPPSPDCLFRIVWKVAYSRSCLLLWKYSRPVAEKHFVTRQYGMGDFTQHLRECITVERGDLPHLVFQKWTVYVSYLISSISVIC